MAETVVVAASAVIIDSAGRVALIKRGTEPDRGLWSVPGGCVESGESFADAAAREAHEETGLHVHIGRELWHVRVPTDDGRVYEIRSEEHTSELQSRGHIVCRLLLEKIK